MDAGVFCGMSALVVDDDADMSAMLDCLLTEMGFIGVTRTGSVDEALDRVHRERPTVALVDLCLGMESGAEIAQELQAAGVPFVFCTATPSLLPAVWRHAPLLKKPLTALSLRCALHVALGASVELLPSRRSAVA